MSNAKQWGDAVEDYRVDKMGQESPRVCWKACGRMMWHWKYRVDLGTKAEYEKRAGVHLQVDRGYTSQEMADFYKMLGMRVLNPAYGANVRYALQWTPVIVALDSDAKLVGGHVVVVIGFHGGHYNVIDPVAIVNFENSAGYDAKVVPKRKGDFDRRMVREIYYW